MNYLFANRIHRKYDKCYMLCLSFFVFSSPEVNEKLYFSNPRQINKKTSYVIEEYLFANKIHRKYDKCYVFWYFRHRK